MRRAALGLGLVLLALVVGADFITVDPNATLVVTQESRAEAPPWPPDKTHWLGTDSLGRDVGARLLHGARTSLFIALFATALSFGVGAVLGALAGWRRGWLDLVLARLLEVTESFPVVLLVVLLASVSQLDRRLLLPVVLGLTRWTDVARLTRARTLVVADLPFVQTARLMGLSPVSILFRHVLPNALAPAVAQLPLLFGSTMLLEVGLTFVGLGVQAPTPSWGELLLEGQRGLQDPGAWWLVVFPGAAVGLTVLVVQGLRWPSTPFSRRRRHSG